MTKLCRSDGERIFKEQLLNSSDLLKKFFNHLSYLMNRSDVDFELQKLMSIEITTNPQARDLEYLELLNVVILRLIDFYQDPQFEQAWFDYLDSLEQEKSNVA